MKLIKDAFYVVQLANQRVGSDHFAVWRYSDERPIGAPDAKPGTWYAPGDEERCPPQFVKRVVRRVRLPKL